MATDHFSIKSGKKGTAAEHSKYIAREGKHKKSPEQNDLITTQHGNLPYWTNGNPFELWKAADKYERQNGSAYREFEIALPNELSTEQHMNIVNALIKDHVGKKPYQLAVHSPSSSIEGVPQPHVHLMMSDRIDDGLERSPDQFFRRFNKAYPERGGCKKDSGGREPRVLKEQTVTLRANIGIVINSELAKCGHSARVDYRSHKDKGIDKAPEKHLGQGGVKKLQQSAIEEIKAKRKIT